MSSSSFISSSTSSSAMKTPQADGFYMPGEFHKHEACWMLWPERKDVWRTVSSNIQPAQQSFVEVATAIRREGKERVIVCVSPLQKENARKMLPDDIEVLDIASDDAWMRDIGPTFLLHKDGKSKAGIHFRFNAWGGLYSNYERDALVPAQVLSRTNHAIYPCPIILEGGSIHVDGEGTCLTTEECLLNTNRNPHLTKEQIEAYLFQFLNVQKVIWLPYGVYNDETDGHVDNMCCFASPGVVLLCWTDDPTDPQFERSVMALDVLSKEKDAMGRPLRVVKLHQPTPMFISADEAKGVVAVDGSEQRAEGHRLAGSYVNFYIANDAIVFPSFNDAKYDQEAKNELQKCFPEKKIVGVVSREILLGGGNIHCITQQQPTYE